MGHTTRLALGALAVTTLLTACADSVVAPRIAAPGEGSATICAEPIDILYNVSAYCGDPDIGQDPPPPPPPPPPPFDPPPSQAGGVIVPVDYYGISYPLASTSCQQNPHVYLATGYDVTQGTPLHPAGVVVRNTKARFYFYNQAGQLVKTHLTQPARSNCVIHQEPEAMSTWDMAPGYYYVYANFWTLPYPYYHGTTEPVHGHPLEHGTIFVTAVRIR